MVTSLLRSMDFVSNQRVIQMEYLQNKIGQMAHNFQSVFSFFLPEFKPYGLVGETLLVSPEATILDTPNIIGILNGAISLINMAFRILLVVFPVIMSNKTTVNHLLDF